MVLKEQGWLWIATFICFSFLVLIHSLNPGDVGATQQDKELATEVIIPIQPEVQKSMKQVRVAVSMNPAEFAALEQLQKQYHLIHGVEVKLENIPFSEVYARFKKASQLGEAADVMLLENMWMNEFSALGYLHAADEVLPLEQQTIYLEQTMQHNKWNGYVWGIPKDVNPYVIVYNSNRLKELQMELPPSTPVELAAFQIRVHRPNEGKYGIYFNPQDSFAFFSLLWSMQSEAVLEKKGAADTESAKVLEPFFDTSRAFPAVSATWNPWEQLDKGNIAMMVVPLTEYKQNAKDSMSLLTLPATSQLRTKISWLRGRTYAVSSKSSVSAEAFKWIREMNAMDAQIKLWQAGGGFPALLPAYSMDRVKAEPNFKAITSAIDRAATFQGTPDFQKKLSLIENFMKKYMKGEEGFETVVGHIQLLWNKLSPN